MPHFLVVAYPVPGHINPAVQLAERLARAGASVTFLTTAYARRRMIKSAPIEGLSYATFSDGYDDGPSADDERTKAWSLFKQRGPETLANLLRTLADDHRPVTCVIYTLLLCWAADVAHGLHTPHLLLWLQPAAVFAICHRYFHGDGDVVPNSIEKDPSFSIKLPGLPLLSSEDLPSFLLPGDADTTTFAGFREQFEILGRDERPRLLVNTFDEAEIDMLTAVDGVDQISVGPLISLDFFDGRDRFVATEEGKMYLHSRDYVDWLDSKLASSVVYVSFGSIIFLQENQMMEILNGLLESGHPFLWVVRPGENGAGTDGKTDFWEKLRAVQEKKEGMIVDWCSQLEVLSHTSVGCFVSHCGWNSTVESLAAGLPVVCLPHRVDQPTNAKLVEDVWKCGVRAKVNGEGIYEGCELKRCLDMVMGGESGKEIRRNASRWRDLAKAAVEGGRSDQNIQAFVKKMRDDGVEKETASATCLLQVNGNM